MANFLPTIKQYSKSLTDYVSDSLVCNWAGLAVVYVGFTALVHLALTHVHGIFNTYWLYVVDFFVTYPAAWILYVAAFVYWAGMLIADTNYERKQQDPNATLIH